MSLSSALELSNYGAVLFFGIVTSLYFADMPFENHKQLFFLVLLGFSTTQILFYVLMGEEALYKCYPLLIHLPLMLLIRFVFHRNTYISAIAVLSAYLLCTPRKWFGTFVSSFTDYSPDIANIVSILITLPLLFVVIKYISPHIIRLKYESGPTLCLFFLLPLCYYLLEYAFTVYTDFLYTGSAAIVEFLDSFIVLLFFILSILSLEFLNQKNKAEHKAMLLYITNVQAQKEIAQLSRSEKQSAIYRHDLRHHMIFLQSCISENKLEAATAYIREICDSIESHKIAKYCENEALNLILAFYADKGAVQGVDVNITATATDFSRFQITDLCSLLSNALENAINACIQTDSGADRYIRLNLYEKSNRLCINMVNNYKQEPIFKNNIPVSHVKNHGIGIESMISVVERYGGVYRFSSGNGEFRFQASL